MYTNPMQYIVDKNINPIKGSFLSPKNPIQFPIPKAITSIIGFQKIFIFWNSTFILL